MTSAVGWRWRIIFIWLGQLCSGEALATYDAESDVAALHL